MSEKREKQTKSKRRIWRGVTTATASLLTLSMSCLLYTSPSPRDTR